MKRRSFLAMLGLAPVAAAVPADAAPHLNNAVIGELSVDDLAPGAFSRTWTCPEYAALRRAGLSTEPTRALWVNDAFSGENPSGLELQFYVEDRIVRRVWWAR